MVVLNILASRFLWLCSFAESGIWQNDLFAPKLCIWLLIVALLEVPCFYFRRVGTTDVLNFFLGYVVNKGVVK